MNISKKTKPTYIDSLWNLLQSISLSLIVVLVVFLTSIYFVITWINPPPHSAANILLLFIQNTVSQAIPSLILLAITVGLFSRIQEIKAAEETQRLKEEIALALSQNTKLLVDLKEFGVSNVYPTFPISLVREKLNKCVREVNVVTTWMGDTFTTRVEIANAVKRGCNAKILLLNPSSNICSQRLSDVGLLAEEAQHKLGETVREFQRLCGINDAGLQLFLYNTLPTMLIFQCDETAYVCFYWQGERAPMGPCIEISDMNNSVFGKSISNEFQKLINHSDTKRQYMESV